MQFIDTHCHVHEPEFAAKYDVPVEQIVADARAAGVTTFISVGTSASSSRQAVDFAAKYGTYASLALHPHEVAEKSSEVIAADFEVVETLANRGDTRIVAIGECGLDYYYHKDAATQQKQQTLLRKHLELGLKHGLPFIFHIREAFEDFFAVVDEYTDRGQLIKGVIHSFSATMVELEGCLVRGFYIGLNGIMTFTKDERQLDAAKAIPADRLVLETDAPFLTPKPFRGTMCQMKHVVETAKFLSVLREETLENLAASTTSNAKEIFTL